MLDHWTIIDMSQNRRFTWESPELEREVENVRDVVCWETNQSLGLHLGGTSRDTYTVGLRHLRRGVIWATAGVPWVVQPL